MRALTEVERDKVEAYLPLVYKAAKKMHKRMHYEPDLNDLRQDGVIGLIKAILNTDSPLNVSFTNYALKWINGAMLNIRYKQTHPELVVSEDLTENAQPIFAPKADISLEDKLNIWRLISQLTKLQRQAIIWHYWGGLKNKEIATLLKYTQANSATDLIFRARNNLRKKLL